MEFLNDDFNSESTLTSDDNPFSDLNASTNGLADFSVALDSNFISGESQANFDWSSDAWTNAFNESFTATPQLQATSQDQPEQLNNQLTTRDELLLRRNSSALADLNKKYTEIGVKLAEVLTVIQGIAQKLNGQEQRNSN